MKNLIAFSLVVVISLSASCGQNISQRRSMQIQYAGTGYNTPALFVYYATHQDKNGKLLRRDTLGLFCAPETWTVQDVTENYISWAELGIKQGQYYVKGVNNSCTGAIVTDSSLFLHPHRDGYYKALECCSYPYFSKMKRIGDKFTWQLAIGAFWASDNYPIKTEDVFSTTYQLADTGIINTLKGRQFHHHYTATTSSVYGTSYASYYLCNNVGLTKFMVTDIDQSVYKFDLADRIEGVNAMKFNTFFSWTVEHAHTRPQYIYFDTGRND